MNPAVISPNQLKRDILNVRLSRHTFSVIDSIIEDRYGYDPDTGTFTIVYFTVSDIVNQLRIRSHSLDESEYIQCYDDIEKMSSSLQSLTNHVIPIYESAGWKVALVPHTEGDILASTIAFDGG